MAENEDGPSAADIAKAKDEGRHGAGGGLLHVDSDEERNAREEGKAETAQTDAAERTAEAAEKAAEDDDE